MSTSKFTPKLCKQPGPCFGRSGSMCVVLQSIYSADRRCPFQKSRRYDVVIDYEQRALRDDDHILHPVGGEKYA